jgi:hypothetical protein
MDRREFTKVMGVVAAGMMAGSRALADDTKKPAAAAKTTGTPAADKPEPHVCKGFNKCKGQGADAKNACSGKGSCATSAKHECKAQNKCKGMGGCQGGDAGCAGKNSCEGKGGCKVPLSAEHAKGVMEKAAKDKAGKSSCKGKSGCKGR